MGNNNQRTFKDFVLLFVKGIAMGAANKIPGVSGGIVAFVAGFYPEMIHSLQRLNFKFLKLLFSNKRLAWRYANTKFLIYLFTGSLFSYFGIAQLLDLGFTYFEKQIWGLFFGMIAASIYFVFNQVKRWNYKTIPALVLGAIVGLLITVATPQAESDNLLLVFFCGMIGIAGMTLPGLSGSFLILVIGNYNLLLVDTVNNLFDVIVSMITLNFDFLSNPLQINYLIIMVTFGVGSLFGLISLANILSYVLKKYEQITIATIIGFIAGTISTTWPWRDTVFETNESGYIITSSIGQPEVSNYVYYAPDFNEAWTFSTIGCILLGILLIVGLQSYVKRES